MTFSRRVAQLPMYPMAELPAIKKRLIEQGVDVIDVGAGDADFPPPEIAVKTVARALQDPAMSRYAFQLGLRLPRSRGRLHAASLWRDGRSLQRAASAPRLQRRHRALRGR